MAVRMDDLSSIPKELIVRITLQTEDLAEVYKVVGDSIEMKAISMNESEVGYDVEFKYCEWERLSKALTEYMVKKIDKGEYPKPELWRAKEAISDGLRGLQEERINRLNQGES